MRSHTTNRPGYLTWLTRFHQKNPIFCKKIKGFIWIIQKIENILLPWLVLGMVILIIKSTSLPRLWGSPHAGHRPGPCVTPRSFSSVPATPWQICPQVPSVLPSQAQTLSRPWPIPIPRKAPDAQRWVSQCPQMPAPCWGGRTGPGSHALSQQTPMGSPLILQGLGPGRFKRVIQAFFPYMRDPMPVKMFLCLLFGYPSTSYCLFFSLHGNSSQAFFCTSSGSEKSFQSCE